MTSSDKPGSSHTVTSIDEDIRLDRWFKRHYAGLPHSMLEKYLRTGRVRVDGKKAKASDRVKSGQVIHCPPMEFSEPLVKPKALISEQAMNDLRNRVLYKDDNIIVINKPYGLATQGGTKITRSLDDMLDGLMFENKQRPKLVHRLDRDTSGVLVLARNAKVAASLAIGFAGKSIDKTYWALINGTPTPEKGVIELPLLKATGNSDYERVSVDEDEGKFAKTEYKVIDALGRKFSWIELKPLTGRTHQLRVHMEAIDCPIVGDNKYGGRTTDADALGVEDKLHLHARRIVIAAGLAGPRAIDVTAPLPDHMRHSFTALGLEVPKK